MLRALCVVLVSSALALTAGCTMEASAHFCCHNWDFYDCDSEEAADRCTEGDFSGCERDWLSDGFCYI